jgi:Domain of unknown function (DUF4386)
MAERTTATSPLVYARGAALLNLIILAAGSFAGSVHARLVVPADAATTVNNIIASESLFRLGAVGVLVMNAVFILLVWVLYKLLRPVNRDHALLMVLLALAGATIGMLNQFTQGTVLLLLSGADDLKGFSAEQLNAPVMSSSSDSSPSDRTGRLLQQKAMPVVPMARHLQRLQREQTRLTDRGPQVRQLLEARMQIVVC